MSNIISMHYTNNKILNRVISCVLVIGMALIIAFLPIAEPIAYANEVNKMFEVVGYVVGMFAGGAATSIALESVVLSSGITLAAALPEVVTGFIILVAAVGIGIGVSTLIHILTSEESLDQFGVVFWDMIYRLTDTLAGVVMGTYAEFVFLESKIKSFFGKDAPSVSSFSDNSIINYEKFDSMPDRDYFLNKYSLEKDSSGYIYYAAKPILEDFIGSNNPYEVKSFNNDYYSVDSGVTNKNRFSISTINGCYSFSYFDLAYAVCFCVPVVVDDCLYFVSIDDYTGSRDVRYNSNTYFNNYRLQFWYKEGLAFNNTNYLYGMYSDGTFKRPSSIANWLYMVFVENVTVFYSPDYDIGVNNLSDSDTVNLGNSKGTISGDCDLNNIGVYSDESSYKSSEDIIGGITSSIPSSADVSGSISIGAVDSSSGSITLDSSISNSITITDVDTSDLSAVDSATGENINIKDSRTKWITGVNMVKLSGMSIIDKFPFCIPNYLKKQLNILVAPEAEPIFKIPFIIDSEDIEGDVLIDLTKGSSVLKITDFFLILLLIVGLSLGTKKLFF